MSNQCKHENFNEYFEKCDDCGQELADMPKEIQELWFAYTLDEDHPDPELLQEKADQLRDSLREDGIKL